MQLHLPFAVDAASVVATMRPAAAISAQVPVMAGEGVVVVVEIEEEATGCVVCRPCVVVGENMLK